MKMAWKRTCCANDLWYVRGCGLCPLRADRSNAGKTIYSGGPQSQFDLHLASASQLIHRGGGGHYERSSKLKEQSVHQVLSFNDTRTAVLHPKTALFIEDGPLGVVVVFGWQDVQITWIPS